MLNRLYIVVVVEMAEKINKFNNLPPLKYNSIKTHPVIIYSHFLFNLHSLDAVSSE